jgi:phosphatidylserine/phosphatidylglycerophosphate/cardiolipin synthase-like enzyme
LPERAFAAGGNCWRIERADRAALVVDAADYFTHARRAMVQARRRIMLIGWDFDARIRIGDAAEDGGPETIGAFILWLAKRRPGLEIYLLRWDVGALKSLFRGITPLVALRWKLHKRIHVKLDGAHPFGASHHQKIVVVDDCFAFCGGIDMTAGRWDRRAHRDEDPERVGPKGKPHKPWHDATMALEGPGAAALGDLTRARWARACGGALAPVSGGTDCWPAALKADFEAVDVAIARTLPEFGDHPAAFEIEALFLDLIARARRFLYVETQYFASRRIAEAISRRLREPDGPEIVIVNPEQADGWLEQQAMDTARARLHEALAQIDERGRFRIYIPYTAGGAPIYVHAKIMIVDDVVLRVGSSNMNNRSLRLDTECDVAIDAEADASPRAGAAIRALRTGLLAEHLGVPPERVEACFAETGAVIATIERLAGPGRSLRRYQPPDLNAVQLYLADNEVLDPENTDDTFEPVARRPGLFRRLGRPG